VSGPLDGVTVIEWALLEPGQVAMILGSLGADVIKVEQPGSGDYSRELGWPMIDGEAPTYALSVSFEAGEPRRGRRIERLGRLGRRLVEAAKETAHAAGVRPAPPSRSARA
jgi:hypothetical protein